MHENYHESSWKNKHSIRARLNSVRLITGLISIRTVFMQSAA